MTRERERSNTRRNLLRENKLSRYDTIRQRNAAKRYDRTGRDGTRQEGQLQTARPEKRLNFKAEKKDEKDEKD